VMRSKDPKASPEAEFSGTRTPSLEPISEIAESSYAKRFKPFVRGSGTPISQPVLYVLGVPNRQPLKPEAFLSRCAPLYTSFAYIVNITVERVAFCEHWRILQICVQRYVSDTMPAPRGYRAIHYWNSEKDWRRDDSIEITLIATEAIVE
jgi:hypothetical protein